jgi:hypothetical protein
VVKVVDCKFIVVIQHRFDSYLPHFWFDFLVIFFLLEYGQVVRHRFLISICKGSNPFIPVLEK